MTTVELGPAVVQVLAVEQVVLHKRVADKPAEFVAQVADKLAVQAVEPVVQVAGKLAVELVRMLVEVGKTLQP